MWFTKETPTIISRQLFSNTLSFLLSSCFKFQIYPALMAIRTISASYKQKLITFRRSLHFHIFSLNLPKSKETWTILLISDKFSDTADPQKHKFTDLFNYSIIHCSVIISTSDSLVLLSIYLHTPFWSWLFQFFSE